MGSPWGPLSVGLVPFVGVADRRLKARLLAERETPRWRALLAVYHELQAAGVRGRELGLGNSAGALLFGRDQGEYFRASGAALELAPPSARGGAWKLSLHAERHRATRTSTDFTLAHAFDDGWRFRPNLLADAQDEVGASALLAPWWGTDPAAPQAGVEAYVQGAAGDRDYARTRLAVRGVLPFREGAVRAGVEMAAGTSWGDVPAQRRWFLGGPETLRGYPPSTLVGPSFVRTRVGVTWVVQATSLGIFWDAGWAGEGLDVASRSVLSSVGAGVSVLDDVIHLDVARGLDEPEETRWELYLEERF